MSGTSVGMATISRDHPGILLFLPSLFMWLAWVCSQHVTVRVVELVTWWLTSPRESDLKEQDKSCHWQSPLTIPRKYKQILGNKKANLSIPFVFTRVSLSSRVPHAEALQLALQTRVP